jgi:thermostable 8-oxoguanine DNA glycosylase
MQVAWAGHGETAQRVELPTSDSEVVPGVLWGAPDQFNTPAYWAVRCHWEEENPDYVTGNEDLFREITFCLLGGFGIKYEVNFAAFDRLDEKGFLDARSGSITEETIRSWLLEPLNVNGREVRYRFPNQRARRLARMYGKFQRDEFEGLDVTTLRSSLMSVEGIGPKTASWIIRNFLGS